MALKNIPMTSLERRSLALLSSIYAMRLTGLFVILPIFALYAHKLKGNTPLLMGLALGAYGLTQALLQIPSGMLSDRIGRKPVIAGGLIIFAIGSLIAGSTGSIWGVIIGRAIQGAGAISAAIMALVADLTREEQRNKAMAVVGMTIGATFILSLTIGPVLDGLIGVPGIFMLTAVLSGIAVAVVLFLVPKPVRVLKRQKRSARADFAKILTNFQLLRLDAGIFVLHLVMTAIFVVVPQVIVRYLGLGASRQWELYLPIMVGGFIAMVPFLMMASRKRRTRVVLTGAITLLVVTQLVFYFLNQTAIGLITGLFLFFAAFSLLEAMLPSLVSRIAPIESKGAAIGVYSSSQFFGAFTGATLAGALYGAYGIGAVFLATTGLLVVWWILAVTMSEPKLLASRQLRVGEQTPSAAEHLARKLSGIPGVAEAIVIAEEGVAYLKIDRHLLDEKSLEQFAVS